MPYYRRVGDVPRKRHLRVAQPSGGYLHEELMGTEGFSHDSALLYHRHSPSAIVSAEAVRGARAGFCFEHDLPVVPRHLRTGSLSQGGDPVLDRAPLLGNRDLTVSWVAADADSDLYRNVCGDELCYVHRGSARLESSFGALAAQAGDYVVVPSGTIHRWKVGADGLEILVLEASGHIAFPARYLSSNGQFLEGAPFSERDLRGPEEPTCEDGENVPVLVRSRGGLSRHVHAHHPFDVVGWDGYLYPYAFSICDFEPIVGAIHQPPPVHQTFAGPNFTVCSFVPRPYDFHPQALKVPYHHSNVDTDEVIFYAAGHFMSRSGSGIGEGSVSLHPAGFVHGPQPGSVEGAADAAGTEEVAVMIDAFGRLGLSDEARRVSDPDYPWTWSGSAEA